MRFVCALFAMVALLSATTASAAEARRLALVIGNDAYRNFVPLQRAVADSRAYRDMLQGTRGFEVYYAENADRATTYQKVFQFISNIRPGDTAMVVYSGHGVQLDPDRRDSLFLLPTDIPNVDPGIGAEEAFLSANGIRFSDISQWVKERGARLSIFVLDACRDNPFTNRGGTRSVGLSRGLGRVDAGEGEFVFFAAAPGEVALDRLPYNDDDPNSVFTRTFLKHFKPNTYLEDVANNVQEEVLELSRQASIRQAPYYTDGVAGKTCIDQSCSAPRAAEPAEPTPVATAPGQLDVEETFWRLCETRENPAYCEAYIQQYPEGPRALLAEVRLSEIRAALARAQTPEPPAEKAEPAVKPAVEETRRAETDAAAERLAAEIEARRRAEEEAERLRQVQAEKAVRLEEELAARREAEAEAARLLAQIEARLEAEEQRLAAATPPDARVGEGAAAVPPRQGFVPAPQTAAPQMPGTGTPPAGSLAEAARAAASAATAAQTGADEGKGLVIAALPTAEAPSEIDPSPADRPSASDAAPLAPAMSPEDRQRAVLWSALADSYDLNALKGFAREHDGTVEGEAAEARMAVLREMHLEGQRQLNRAGYWAGRPDGIWGPRSSGALRKFQSDQGLGETGVLTSRLLARLRDMPTKQRAPQPTRSSGSGTADRSTTTPATQPQATPQRQFRTLTTDPTPAAPAAEAKPAPAPKPAPSRPAVSDDWSPFGGHTSM